MALRIASSLALIVFAVCLVVGGFQVGNPFSTVILRALVAMAGTYVIGLLLGGMAQKMLDENVRAEEEKLKNSTKVESNDR